MTLKDILPTISADTGIGRDRSGAPRTVEEFTSRLLGLVALRKFQHDIAGYDGDGEVHFDVSLGRSEIDLLRNRPQFLSEERRSPA